MTGPFRPVASFAIVLALPFITGCSSDEPSFEGAVTSEPADSQDQTSDRFPDIVAVSATQGGDGSWAFDVTVSSPYDSPDRYADGWRVIGPDGAVYGTHTLSHDHATEQPFTRRQQDVAIPDGVTEVVIEGRDQINGFGGGTIAVPLQNG
jgi:hypothetical protein